MFHVQILFFFLLYIYIYLFFLFSFYCDTCSKHDFMLIEAKKGMGDDTKKLRRFFSLVTDNINKTIEQKIKFKFPGAEYLNRFSLELFIKLGRTRQALIFCGTAPGSFAICSLQI